jgi:hypothetical protein
VGIIDSDYYYSDNEGHIFAKLTIDAKESKTLFVNKGEAFMQGIIKQFYLVEDDITTKIRNGGFGSTTNLGNILKEKSNFATEYKSTWGVTALSDLPDSFIRLVHCDNYKY